MDTTPHLPYISISGTIYQCSEIKFSNFPGILCAYIPKRNLPNNDIMKYLDKRTFYIDIYMPTYTLRECGMVTAIKQYGTSIAVGIKIMSRETMPMKGLKEFIEHDFRS